MKFIVDRRTWYRGHGSDTSSLLREDGTRCCIGFVAQQCGIPDSAILNRSDIVEMNYKDDPNCTLFPSWMRDTRNMIGPAYNANDNDQISDAVRETRLKAIFAEQGDEIEFEN